jgi:small subunit ribosomal protein S8
MSLQDLTSDFVARINNASRAGKTETIVLRNKLVENLCKKLTKLGFFQGYEVLDRELKVTLNPAKLNKMVRVSKPGQRIYVSYNSLPRITGGKGFNIVSTSKGIMTGFETQKNKVGGELVLQVF